MYSVSDQVGNFILHLEKEGYKLFPFLPNRNWKPGDQILYSGPYWDDQEPTAAITALLTGKWLPAGENVNKFERAFSKQFEFDHSVMVNSGSSANLVMIAALKKYFGWKDGDEIIVCACGFPTTINPIIQNGLKPVFVDINMDDLNWDLSQVEEKISDRTVAAFSSPVLGNPYDFDKFMEIINANGLKYIADNCDALGSKWRGKFLTENAVAASCSFYPAHHICTIEGGMVSSNIEEVVQIARSFAWWGRGCYCVGSQNKLPNGVCGQRFDRWLEGYDKDVDHKYVFGVQGYNLKPADLQGSIGLIQLTKQTEIHCVRRMNKTAMTQIFSQIPGCRVVEEKEHAETSWFGVPIIYKDGKHHLVKYLEDHGIQTRNYFAGNILMHPAYRDIEPASNYPRASEVLDNVFFVGTSPVITMPMLDYIDEVVLNYIKEHK
jgi:CDP-6-deoxy-D-xylo-4-hexulose-3-dehydrase